MTIKTFDGTEGSLRDFYRLFRTSKLPIIQQAEAAECAIACLAMVANYFGQHVSLSELRRRFSVSTKGTTLKAIVDLADRMGLSSRPVRLELSELANLQRPAILHWEMNHYVVLKAVGRRTITIHDPSQGIRVLPYEEVSRSFTGVALELTPTASFVTKPQAETVRFRDFLSRVYGLIPPVAQIFLLSVVLQAFGALSPILNQIIVDNAISQGNLNLLTVIAVGMGLLVLITAFVRLLQGVIDLYVGTQLSFQLQSNLLRHLLRLPVSWFERRHIGDIISRFSSLPEVQNVLKGSASNILLNAMMVLSSMAMMLIYSPLLTSVEIGTVFFFFGIRLALFPYFRHKSQENLHRSAQVQTLFLETIRGARTFKLFGREQERTTAWQNEQAKAINTTVELSRFALWGGFGTSVLSGMQNVIVWFLGARFVIHGNLTLGMLLAFRAYTEQFSAATSALIGQFFAIKTARIHLERLSDIVQAEPERGIDHEGEFGHRLRGDVSIQGLSFRYAEHEPWVLRDVSLDIKAGEFVCFTGLSGQGKTTLLKLLLGFDEPIEGRVSYDAVEMRRLGIRNIRTQIGAVLQDDQLFNGTIAENVCFFEADAPQEDIERAAMAAQIHHEITQMPMGYMTLVGDLGSSLSGGQRQRILIARALYRKPKILFLDEGTSNLDPQNEQTVMEVIRSLPITRIVIAHREAAIEGADRIFEVGQGQVTTIALETPTTPALEAL